MPTPRESLDPNVSQSVPGPQPILSTVPNDNENATEQNALVVPESNDTTAPTQKQSWFTRLKITLGWELPDDTNVGVLQSVAEKIKSTEKYPVLDTVQTQPLTLIDTLTDWMKWGFAVLMLLGRALACLYRFVLMRDTIGLFLTIPGLHLYADAKHTFLIKQIIAGVFASSDVVRTMDSTQAEVIGFFQHPDYKNAARDFWQSAKKGDYPRSLLISALFVAFSTAIKARDGFQETLEQASTLPHLSSLKNGAFAAYIVAFCSAACFIAFMVFGRSMWVARTKMVLANDENWIAFRETNPDSKRWLYLRNLMGKLLSTLGALSAGIPTFYVDGHFKFDLENVIFFFLMVPANAYSNYTWSFNPYYQYKAILKEAEKREQQQPLQAVTISATTEDAKSSDAVTKAGLFALSFNQQEMIKRARRYNNLFCSLGGGFVMCPAIIRALQVMLYAITLLISEFKPNNTQPEAFSKNPWFILTAFIISIPAIIGIFLQDVSMMQKDSKETASPKTSISQAR